MADLIERSAALKALGERPLVWSDTHYEIGQVNQYDLDYLAIQTVPAVDGVLVVRCKDCIHYTHWAERWPGRDYCPTLNNMMRPDDFCSYGERKDGKDGNDGKAE